LVSGSGEVEGTSRLRDTDSVEVDCGVGVHTM